tara:strand:- start:690 stop:2618 length:1929 start_codon:yes stop_codon:yes gene_type:complete
MVDPKDKEVKLERGIGPKGKEGWYAFRGTEKPTWLGVRTGGVTEEAKELRRIFEADRRFTADEDAQTFSEGMAVALHDLEKRKFDRGLFESDRAYGQAIKEHEDSVILAMIQNRYTEQKILNQAEQFRMKYDQGNKHFDATQSLKIKIHNAKMSNWTKQFNHDVKVNGQTHELAAKRLEHDIINDGIQNGFKADEIKNQVNQFREKQNLAEKGLELNQNIFNQQVEADNRNYNLNVEKFNKTFAQQQYTDEAAISHQKRVHDQNVIEHLALIKQRGVDNYLNEQEIALKQQEFLDLKGHRIKGRELDMLKHKANVENKAKEIAQQLAEFEYEKIRDRAGDRRKDTEWQQDLQEYRDKLVQQAFDNDMSIKGLELKREIFEADIDIKKQKLATEGSQAPMTLTGEAARNWAKEPKNNFKLPEDRQGLPVIKINKHGQFESLSWVETEKKYDKDQLTELSRINEKWLDSSEVKGANKITRLARSLRQLADNETGVSEFAMIYKFMKSLDETSTVLASEFRNARGAGLSAFDALMLWGDKQFTGKQLDDVQKYEIVEAVRTVARNRLKLINENRESFVKRAEINKISRADAEAMMPNAIADYFKEFPENKFEKFKPPETVINDPIANAIENRQAYSPSSTSVITQ